MIHRLVEVLTKLKLSDGRRVQGVRSMLKIEE